MLGAASGVVNKLHLVSALLALGVSQEAIDNPAYKAILFDRDQALSMLRKFGARFEIRNRGTMLHMAADRSSSACLETLLRDGEDVDARDPMGKTALHKSVNSDSDAQMLALLRAGAAIDSVDSSGFAALHYAVLFGKLHCVRSLLASGADIELRNDACRSTPLQLAIFMARRSNNPGVMEVLLRCAEMLASAGANPSPRHSDPVPPRVVAAVRHCMDALHPDKVTALLSSPVTSSDAVLPAELVTLMRARLMRLRASEAIARNVDPFGHLEAARDAGSWTVISGVPRRQAGQPMRLAVLGILRRQMLVDNLNAADADVASAEASVASARVRQMRFLEIVR